MNDQHREFTDFRTFESQNWVMLSAEQPWRGGEVRLTSMLSLEPFTLKKIGSPQVFQTGETFEGAPLVDYQHPHDLFTNLGASYSRSVGDYRVAATAAAAGSPALGPDAFMHRPSAAENPQAPLSHHHLDSTHITPGVLSLGISRGPTGLEASWFRGREPDEKRTDLDLGALDSWSMRGTWTQGPWNAQVSGGHLHEPEITQPGRDMVRLTASGGYVQTHGGIITALFAAWGQNREAHGNLNAFLFESNISWLGKNYLYSRAEAVAKDILKVGYDPVGFFEVHPISQMGAFTLGYTRDLNGGNRPRVGLGGDVTMYYVPENLKESYGGPVSLHFFVRVRFTSAADSMAGMEHHH